MWHAVALAAAEAIGRDEAYAEVRQHGTDACVLQGLYIDMQQRVCNQAVQAAGVLLQPEVGEHG
jgi:hypothetical protein